MKAISEVSAGRSALQLVHDANRVGTDWPHCQHCNQPLRRYERHAKNRQIDYAYEDCKCLEITGKNREKVLASLREAIATNPIPKRFAAASLAHEDRDNHVGITAARAMLEALKVQPDGEGISAFGLCGPKGVGKTYIAYGLVRALRDLGIPALAYTVGQMDRAVKATFGDEKKREALFSRLVSTPLLVIDDLGKEYARSDGTWTDSFLFDVVDERYLAMLPVVVTSNFTPDVLEQHRYKDSDRLQAILDRLHEIFDGGRSWLLLEGDTRRVRL